MYDYPVKAAATLGALNNDPDHGVKFDSPNTIKKLVLVNLNTINGHVDVHVLNTMLLEAFWYKWLDNLKNFWLTVLRHQ
jgi:hypothetical protein